MILKEFFKKYGLVIFLVVMIIILGFVKVYFGNITMVCLIPKCKKAGESTLPALRCFLNFHEIFHLHHKNGGSADGYFQRGGRHDPELADHRTGNEFIPGLGVFGNEFDDAIDLIVFGSDHQSRVPAAQKTPARRKFGHEILIPDQFFH